MGMSIQGLENDYLRDQINRANKLSKAKDKILIEEIYNWIMANEDMGMGDAATAMDEAETIVSNWKSKCKNIK